MGCEGAMDLVKNIVPMGLGNRETFRNSTTVPPGPGKVQDFQNTCFNLGNVWKFDKSLKFCKCMGP